MSRGAPAHVVPEPEGVGRPSRNRLAFRLDRGHGDAVSHEEALTSWGSGLQPSAASRRADVVLRTAGPWSPAVLALLRHFAEVGFDGAPRPVGTGVAEDGREAITYLPGSSPHPQAWADDALPAVRTHPEGA